MIPMHMRAAASREKTPRAAVSRLVSGLWCLVVGHGWLTTGWNTSSHEVYVRCTFCDQHESRSR